MLVGLFSRVGSPSSEGCARMIDAESIDFINRGLGDQSYAAGDTRHLRASGSQLICSPSISPESACFRTWSTSANFVQKLAIEEIYMHGGQLKREKSAANFGEERSPNLCTSVMIGTLLLVSQTNCISSDFFLCSLFWPCPVYHKLRDLSINVRNVHNCSLHSRA